MNDLTCYIPIDRRLALQRNEMLPDHGRGTVLIADISGFTPLTAAYDRALGARQAAEEVIHQINRVYDALVAEVHQYRGSVLYFSGDAITCWFEHDDGLRVVACALAMQQRMKAFAAIPTPLDEMVSLSIKVAIAGGPVRRFTLGDPAHRLMDVVVGSPLDRMATAETVARAAEVVVAGEMVAAHPDRFVVAEWRTANATGERFAVISGLVVSVPPTPWPVEALTPPLTDEQVRPWLITAVYDRIKAATTKYLAELRPAVALFLQFGGLDYDGDEQVGDKLGSYFREVQRIIARYEGTPLEFTTGDKGSYLYAAFGAPIAHEDDADRALLAAQELRDLSDQTAFIDDVQIGISRGQMRVGPYGSWRRRNYGAFGHETNMAARLMTTAVPGEIVVSERVARALVRKDRFVLDRIGSLTVKGSTDPLVAYRLQDIRAGGRAKTPVGETAVVPHVLIGREQERRRLSTLLQQVHEVQSNVVLVKGEAGMGKSYILQDFLAEARERQILTLIGEANAIEQASPYLAWRAVFSALFGLDGVAPTAQARQAHVLAQLPPDDDLRDLAPLLNAVVSLDLPDTELTRELSGLSRANKTHDLLTAVLQHKAAGAPLLIVIEDAHWLDSASWALAEAVQQAVHPLLLVLVARPFERQTMRSQTGLLSPLATADTTHQIWLQALSVEDTLTLVCHRLGVRSLPTVIANFIAERAEGHPFFSEELAYALREARVIQVVDGECRLAIDPTDLLVLDFPTTIEGVITSRIDRLNPAQQLAIKVSSVIGRIFAFKTLADIHPVAEERPFLTTYLDELNQLDITLLESPEPDLAYMFKHVITQQVAYNRLLFAQRRDLHRKVALWYESYSADDLESLAPLLAYHWFCALDLNQLEPAFAEKAIHYAELAGDQAVRKYANQEAVGFFHDAQTIADALHDPAIVPESRLAHWALQLGEAHLGLGQLVQAREQFERCLRLHGWPVAESQGGMTWGLLKEFAWRGVPKRPLIPTPSQRQSLQEAARAYELLGQVYYLINQPVPTMYAMVRGLNLAERVGQGTPELARAYANIGGAVALLGLQGQSRKFETRAWETIGEVSHRPSLAYVAFITSVTKINTADWDESNRGFQQGLELARQLGDRRTAGFCISGMAHIALFRGYIGRSMALFEELEQLGESGQDVTHWSTGLGGKAAIMLRWGSWLEALRYSEQSLSLAITAGNSLAEWSARTKVGLARFKLGQLDLARQTVDESFETVIEAPQTSFANTIVYAEFIMLLLMMWEQTPGVMPDARTRAAELLKRYQRYTRVFPFAQPPYWRLLGWYDWLNGRESHAFKAWSRALTAAARKEMPYETGMTHYEVGRHLPETDPRRGQHLGQAVGMLTELEATYDAARAKVALRRDDS